jgi:DNA-binding transcriptional regulator LsrR (DeoR family)
MSIDVDLLVRISTLYYEQGVNQNEIAEICQIERSRISRLLLQARNQGIVQFHVVNPTRNNTDLGERLQKKYGLQEAIVFDTLDIPDHFLKKTIGLVAAKYISNILKDGDILAISWGETIFHTVQGLQSEFPRNVIVVPALGGSSLLTPAYQVNEIANKAAEKLGGFSRTLYAPAFVDTRETRDAMIKSKDIQAITDLWKSATVALVGIGRSPFTYRAQANVDQHFGQFYLYEHEQKELLDHGVMGDINARFFGEDGKELNVSIHDRVIGMSFQDLMCIPKVIGVAGGSSKVDAIHSVLSGRDLSVLITDSLTAQGLALR